MRPPTSMLLSRMTSRILAKGMPKRAQAAGIDDDVVLLDEAADAGDLGDAFGLGQTKADLPILQRAQIRQRLVLAQHGVLIDPADAAGVGAEGRRYAGRQSLGRRVEIFEDAAARPVDVGAVLEDDVDERHAEEREPAHHLGARHGQHRRGQRIGDLVLDHLRCLAGKLGVDDDLRVREVGNGVERQRAHRPHARHHREGRGDEHQHQVSGRPGDETGDHRLASVLDGAVKPFSAACRLLSASMRKLPLTTTRSPSAMPLTTSTKPSPLRPSLTSRGSKRPSP